MYKPINVKKEYRDKLKVYAATQKKTIIELAHEWIDSLTTRQQEPLETNNQ
jgi:hypothetical protein